MAERLRRRRRLRAERLLEAAGLPVHLEAALRRPGAAFDVAVLGAGAAGLHAAALAGQRGLRVVLLDHATEVAEKIRISGGGRCNFTNLHTAPIHFDSENPDYCRSALARYSPQDFIDLVERHGIAWHEKHRGQLFCDGSSRQIVDMLVGECLAAGVERRQPCRVDDVSHDGSAFALATSQGGFAAHAVVVATGGLSIPKIGATDLGYRIARRFGHRVVEPRPALVPLVLDGDERHFCESLAGVALPARVATTGGAAFDEDLLFTHRGLSGPAALQASTYWRPGQRLSVGLLAATTTAAALLDAKRGPSRGLASVLAERLPRRLVDAWLAGHPLAARTVPDWPDRELRAVAAALADWTPLPSGTEGWKKAEVTAGGVDTRELDSRSGQSRLRPGLFFVGEVVDVTGWLGGFNFQWAWASAAACASSLAAG